MVWMLLLFAGVMRGGHVTWWRGAACGRLVLRPLARWQRRRAQPAAAAEQSQEVADALAKGGAAPVPTRALKRAYPAAPH
jgi:hypothetical protein